MLLTGVGRYWSHLAKATKIILTLPRDIHSSEVTNLPFWNRIIQFFIRRLLIISFNILNDTSIDPLRDLIATSRFNCN